MTGHGSIAYQQVDGAMADAVAHAAGECNGNGSCSSGTMAEAAAVW